MSGHYLEQRIQIKLYVKLNKSASEKLEMLKVVYGDEVMSRTRVFDWHTRFKEHTDDIHDDALVAIQSPIEHMKTLRRSEVRYAQIANLLREMTEKLNLGKETD